ncbi:MAG: MFS transporter [Paenalcaligenes sp.]
MKSAPLALPPTTTTSQWLAVMAVALATFSVVTTEMLPVGLLTSIAHSLHTTTGSAGLMISLPALLAAFFAPLVVIAAGNVDRRHILSALLALLALANLASALAPSLGWMLAARIVVGFCMGGIWAIAGGLAARLVAAPSIGLATSLIFGGVAAASVLGVPLGAFIGDALGWRWAFGGMALFSLLILLLQRFSLPPLPVQHSITLQHFKVQLHNRALLAGLLLTLLLVAGHFVAFTFVRPLLLSLSHIPAQWISALLFAYGIAGIAGNFLAGMIAATRTRFTLFTIALGLALIPILFLWLGHSPSHGTVLMILWGVLYGGVSVSLMTWMMRAAPQAIEIATALYVGVFNIGIAAGSWTGGQLVDSLGLHSMLGVAATTACGALLLSLTLRFTETTKGA